ncbi:MAG: hypothetical protein ACD_68C00124G0001 [uncultured bacterium]|nr:MAG: hypothetical protein ACD_68C00124G0001 [uncultured bacterium]
MPKYSDIIPFLKVKELPGKRQFSYSVPASLIGKLDRGKRVLIPWRSSYVTGIVEKIYQKPREKFGFKIKPISNILDEKSLIDENHWRLSEWLAKYYGVSLGSVLKLMLPPLSPEKKKISQIAAAEKQLVNFKHPLLTIGQNRVCQKILAEQKKGKRIFLLQGVTSSGKTEIYFHLIDKMIGQGKQTIVLAPEFSLMPQMVKRLTERFGENNLAIIHSRLTPKEKQTAFREIAENKRKIIVGPRSAIFAPAFNLGLIVVDEEHDQSFKQNNLSPRYRVNQVARVLAELYDATLILGSATPSLEEMAAVEKNQSTLLTLRNRIIPGIKKARESKIMPKIILVDLQEERRRQNFDILSGKLESSLRRILREKKQALLFINRRGLAPILMCQKCGAKELCRPCQLPLTYHLEDQGGILICHHCGEKRTPPLKCSHCQNPNIQYNGFGTQKVEEEVRRKFPRAKIIRIDRDTTKKKHSLADFYQQTHANKVDIIIGTQMLTKGWDIPKMALVGVLSAENFLLFPDFRSQERMWQTITQVIGRSGRTQMRGEAIIQTYQPDLPVFKAIKNHNDSLFYQNELIARQELFYPPFSQMIRLWFQHFDEEKARNEAEKLAAKINQEISAKTNQVQLLGPTPCFLRKVRNQYRFHIILKLPKTENVIKDKLFKLVPPNWKIDVDPEDTL